MYRRSIALTVLGTQFTPALYALGLDGSFATQLGAAPQHALAPELLLRPVLTEIGCSCPLPGLYLLDSQYSDSPELSTWLLRAQAVLPALSGTP